MPAPPTSRRLLSVPVALAAAAVGVMLDGGERAAALVGVALAVAGTLTRDTVALRRSVRIGAVTGPDATVVVRDGDHVAASLATPCGSWISVHPAVTSSDPGVLAAVLAHEHAHLRRRHWAASYVLVGGVGALWAALPLWVPGGWAVPVICAAWLVFVAPVRAVERRSELTADADAADTCGADAMIAALELFTVDSSGGRWLRTHPPVADRVAVLHRRRDAATAP